MRQPNEEKERHTYRQRDIQREDKKEIVKKGWQNK
jgi:hypothetical protein